MRNMMFLVSLITACIMKSWLVGVFIKIGTSS
jgi:hypothetical protein